MQSLLRPRTIVVWLFVSVLAAAPALARHADDAVRAAVASGQAARVIMQFATTAERDAAFTRLLDRGAAVRSVDTEGGPALVVFGSAAAFSGEISRASQVSLDASVHVLAAQPARDTSAANRDASGNVIHWGRRIIYGDRFARPKYAEVHMLRWDDAIVWAYDALADDIVWGNARTRN